MRFEAFDSAADFLESAEEFLLAEESRNSLALGLALRTRDGNHPMDLGTRFFLVQDEGRILGTASQTPGYAVVFTSMSPEAARHAARKLPSHLPELHGCNGPVDTVDVVAREWRRAGLGDLEVSAQLRLFELTELERPRRSPGSMRLATDADFETCREYLYRFLIDCNLPEATPGVLPERVHPLEQRRVYLWEVEGEPVACAAWARPARNGITIGYVYTPDAQRGRGYASNLVAELTAGLLDGSLYSPARSHVNLFTDLSNPTSNAIYQRMGYRGIEDFRHYRFRRT